MSAQDRNVTRHVSQLLGGGRRGRGSQPALAGALAAGKMLTQLGPAPRRALIANGAHPGQGARREDRLQRVH